MPVLKEGAVMQKVAKLAWKLSTLYMEMRLWRNFLKRTFFFQNRLSWREIRKRSPYFIDGVDIIMIKSNEMLASVL